LGERPLFFQWDTLNEVEPRDPLRTKNGINPETEMTLGTLIENFYGESYDLYFP
jgi:hypothetical protein